MLHLYQSNRLETLIDLLTAVVEHPPQCVFEPETVIVPSQGMGRWISLQLADRVGICANTDFLLPASFTWQLLRKTLGDLPNRSYFDPQVLVWRIMHWLADPQNLKQFDRLNNYLKIGGDFRRFELADRIARVFDQYLIYRPDWINAWDKGQRCKLGEDEIWQADLWSAITHETAKPHRLDLMKALFKSLDSASNANDLPERITLFGLSSLPPIFGELVKKLSATIDVYLFVANPCAQEWGRIFDFKEIDKQVGENDPGTLYLETGNPLLASLGKQGREYFDAVYAEYPEIHSLFSASQQSPQSILQILQHDILNLVDRTTIEALPVSSGDRSLQIHVCHSPMREVEVLHDQLLALFESDSDLQPGDVAVLMPDIADYAPQIEAVFATDNESPAIPFTIADRGIMGEQPLLATFMELLDLPDSRFNADQIMGLLEKPAILRRFGLNASDLPLIIYWLEGIRIRWGRDAAHKEKLGLPGEQLHTWMWGLKRLLLGYALPQCVARDKTPIFAGILPFDDIEGQHTQTLAQLIAFLERLFDLGNQLDGKKTLAQWSDTLTQMLDDIFSPDAEEETATQQLRTLFALLRDLATQANYSEGVGLKLIKSWLNKQLQQSDSGGGFLTGNVTFCTLIPMRSLPFKVICLLGMDDSAFPRQHRPAEFDLIGLYPRAGDRSRRSDDRYCFLETLLSARQTLLVSYTGRDIRNDTLLPPSVLVAELIEAVASSCQLSDDSDIIEQIVINHRLQPFHSDYFTGNTNYPGFSNAWLDVSKTAGKGTLTSVPLFSTKLPDPEPEWSTLSFDDLSEFYRNPARYLLRKRMGISLYADDDPVENREPFSLDYFSRQEIRENELSRLAQDLPTSSANDLAKASGLLPHGGLGERIYSRERAKTAQLAASIIPLMDIPELDPVAIELSVGDVSLNGWLKQIRPQGLVAYRLAKITPFDRFNLWLRHLVLCITRPQGVKLQSRFIAEDKQVLFAEITDDPKELMSRLLKHYKSGLSLPLPFFVKSGLAYCESLSKGKDQDAAIAAAHQVWNPPDYARSRFFGESENAYYQTVYRSTDPLGTEFRRLAQDLIMPMHNATEEIPS